MKSGLDETKLLYVSDRRAWRAWLKKHHRSQADVWLVYYKKHTGRPRLAYNDAVEEALCFGWIDSTVRRLDADRFAQRFSVRNPKTPYSQANKERLKALIQQGQVARHVLAALGDLAAEPFEVPPDILAALQADPQAWQNFQGFSPAYIRIRVAFIDGARRRPAEFAKRLRHFVALTAQNRQFGFGGIEKHY
jgi:uncharacterized protein YdeI (YjbR/CyaY-like superfamily)